jgi:hypothetical protein
VDVVHDVGGVIVSFLDVLLDIGNGIWNVDRFEDADKIGMIVSLSLAVMVKVLGGQRRIRGQEEVGTAVSKNRPVVAVTVWPDRRYAGTDTINEPPAETD